MEVIAGSRQREPTTLQREFYRYRRSAGRVLSTAEEQFGALQCRWMLIVGSDG